jgi:hypothetical protein
MTSRHKNDNALNKIKKLKEKKERKVKPFFWVVFYTF